MLLPGAMFCSSVASFFKEESTKFPLQYQYFLVHAYTCANLCSSRHDDIDYHIPWLHQLDKFFLLGFYGAIQSTLYFSVFSVVLLTMQG